MSHDDLVYLGHMLDTARKVAARVDAKARSEYDADEDLQVVLAHFVQTIGEAARRVSATFQDRHRGIPWRKIIGMRHRIVHDYLNINLDILWEVVTRNIPELITMLSPLVGSEDEET